mmetsp:Transcript_2784/g.9791  ORF Transcript_2784/g.9791 Transcript_2784/m.9791 type:complete len:822 (+) Transcript_2784:575-3040(+)
MVKGVEKDGGSGDNGSENTNIEIFLRLKPTPSPSKYCEVEASEGQVEFNIPRDVAAGYVNNQREHYEYRFNGVLGMDAKQDEVFERVARRPVLGAMQGINGTVFAYGQTGSGKTFTITGGAERYVDRGMIPRAISLVFSEISKRADYQYTVHISYLEIYNDTGYDLLDPNHDTKQLEDLQRVSLLEDDDGNMHLRNLGAHRANNEEEALNLLFLGDTNRAISETPMNMASSRSHCIFTMNIEARQSGAETVRRSKLHLVDLAGSERVSKTGVNGTILREAKYINLSLHYLEQVIIALQERAAGVRRPHVPYRNSMMTSVLRDSLGGNCRTCMIATVSPENAAIDESISTCRFAQRVAMISNVVQVNEEMDPASVIKRLKQEVRELKEEIRLLKGEDEDADRGPLTEGEKDRIAKQVAAYVEDNDPEASLSVGSSMLFIRGTWQVFKEMLRKGGGVPRPGGGVLQESGAENVKGKAPVMQLADENDPAVVDQIKKLQLQVRQRDNEINILVSMLQKREGGRGDAATTAALAAARDPAAALAAERNSKELAADGGATSSAAASPSKPKGISHESSELELLNSRDLLADRNKAFELFRKSYRKNEVIEENKQLLKSKYEEAKALGAGVNASRNRINELKALIEQRRIQRGVQAVAEGGVSAEQESGADPQEERARAEIESEKSSYRESFDRLRALKKEIEHLQLLLEQSRKRLTADFEEWLKASLRQQANAHRQPEPAALSPATNHPRPPAASHSTGRAPRQAWGEDHVVPQRVQPPVQTLQLPSPQRPNAPPLTGDPSADADIQAFYAAREKLLQSRAAAMAR